MTIVAHISNDGPQILCTLLGAHLDRGHSFLVAGLLSRRARAPFGLLSFTPRAATPISEKATLADLRSQRESHGYARAALNATWALSRIVGRSFACNPS